MTKKENKGNKCRIKLKTIAGLFLIIAAYCTIYILLEHRADGFAVLAGGMLMLIAGYLWIVFSEQEKKEREAEHEAFLADKLDELISVQKALYTTAKKNNEIIGEELQQILATQNSGDSVEALHTISSMQERMMVENKRLAEAQINAMKAVAKYNKENARQLATSMNENTDRIMKQIPEGKSDNYEQLFDSMKAENASMEQRIGRKVQEAIYDVEERYQSMTETMLSNTVTMTERIEALGEQIENLEFRAGAVAATVEYASTDDVETEPVTESSFEPEPIVEPEPESEPEPELEPIVELEPEPAVEPEAIPESAPAPAAKPEMPVIDDPNRAMTPDEIAAMIAAMTGESTTAEEPESEPEPGSVSEPEPVVEPELESIVELEPEPAGEPEAIPESAPAPAAKPEMPVIDDPNRAMTPDEIAAMIAALTQ